MKHTNNPQEHIINSIQASKEKLFDRQDAYRTILDDPSIDKAIAEAHYASLTWDNFLLQFDDFYYPIDQKILDKYLINPKEFKTRTELRIEKINETKVSHHVYFLNLFNIHTQRLKVLAELHHQFGALDYFYVIYMHWIRYSQCQLLLKEIHHRSELITDNDDGITNLEIDVFASKLMLTGFIGLKLPDSDTSTLEDIP
jgi:hypothetical protein